MMTKNCKICNKLFDIYQSKKAKYCSRKCFYLGRIGHKVSEKTKVKIRKGHLGKKLSKEHKTKLSLAKMGKHHSEETRKKMSLNSGQKGSKNIFWRGGITPEHQRIRHSLEIKLWREAVFKRDNWTCQECKIRGSVILNADHIKPFAYFPELRLAIDNGRTLCKPCHKKTDTYMVKVRWKKYDKR